MAARKPQGPHGGFRHKPAGAARCPSARLRKAKLHEGHAIAYPGVAGTPVDEHGGGSDFWGHDLCAMVSEARRRKDPHRRPAGRARRQPTGSTGVRLPQATCSYILSDEDRAGWERMSLTAPARRLCTQTTRAAAAAAAAIVAACVGAAPPPADPLPAHVSGAKLSTAANGGPAAAARPPNPAGRGASRASFMPFLAMSTFSPSSNRLFLPSTSKMLSHGRYVPPIAAGRASAAGAAGRKYSSLSDANSPPATCAWSYARQHLTLAPMGSQEPPPEPPQELSLTEAVLVREPQTSRFKTTTVDAPRAADPRRAAGVHSVTLPLPDPIRTRLGVTGARPQLHTIH